MGAVLRQQGSQASQGVKQSSQRAVRDPVTFVLREASSGLATFSKARAAQDFRGNLEFNRAIALQNANLERGARGRREQQSRRLARRFKSENRVRVAKSGVRADVGSPLEVAGDVAAQLERGILEERLQSQIQENAFRNQAIQLRRASRNVRSQAKLQTAADILGGIERIVNTGR